MTFYIGYIINDLESDYTTLVVGKTNVKKMLSTSVSDKTNVVITIQHWFR